MAKIKTYQKILNCATSMFAQHGYEGTIMDDLAKLSGANKASIYYHHKDKITLYENTLTALFTPIADAVVEGKTEVNFLIRCFAKNVFFP